MRNALLIIVFILTAADLTAVTNDSVVRIALDPITLEDRQIVQEFYAQLPFELKKFSIHLTCYDVTDKNDSIQVYRLSLPNVSSERKSQGVYYKKLQLTKNTAVFQPVFKSILLKNGSLPAGSYRTYIEVRSIDTVLKRTLFYNVDSSLSLACAARSELDDVYGEQDGRKILGVPVGSAKATSQLTSARNTIRKSANKIKSVLGRKGYVVSYREHGHTTFVDLHYQGRYVGYYEVDMNVPPSASVKNKKSRLQDNIASGLNNELESSKTLFGQVKELYEESRKKEVAGNISVIGNAATGQEEYSRNENNYYEVIGQVEVPVMNIPVSIEGYYTSQDKRRITKASYIRLHYDTEQAKAELLKLISAYNSKYEETASKGKGLQSIYQTYLNQLADEKAGLLNEVKNETGITNMQDYSADTTGLLKVITANYEKKLADSLVQTRDSLKDNNKTAATITDTWQNQICHGSSRICY